MSKTQKPTISYREPAKRPVSVGLSAGELYALILHHEKQIKSITRSAVKTIGQHAKNKRDIDAVHKEAGRQIQAHANRAEGLGSILKSIIE